MSLMMGNPPICSLLFQPGSDTTGSAWRESSGHLGEVKTLAKIRERFYWPGMTASVHEWCQTCHSCMSPKGPQQVRQEALLRFM